MVILREKVRGILSRKLLMRESEYDTMRTRTVLTLHQTKTAEREMNRRRTVCTIKTIGEDDG